MLNILWPIFIIISFVYAIFTGKMEDLNSSITESTSNALRPAVYLPNNVTVNTSGNAWTIVK